MKRLFSALLLVALVALTPVAFNAQGLRATATAHDIAFTWTPFNSSISGIGVNLYCGPSAGAELSSPINSALLATDSGAYTWSSVTAGSTYFCVARSAAGSVVSAPSNEVSATVPLVSSDLPVPSGFAGSAQ